MSAELDYQIALEATEGEIASLPAAEDVTRWVNATLECLEKSGDTELTVRVVTESEMTQLNNTYRHQDSSTNVLSFPFDAPPGVSLPLIGDLVVCAAVVEREALQQNKPPANHWAHMIVHGVLHLLGYDHISDSEAEQMEQLEINILSQLGYPDPYQQLETL